MPDPQRHYFPLWKRTRDKHKCVVLIAAADLGRFRRGIIKEKKKDYGFRLETDQRLVFTAAEVNGSQPPQVRLTVTLRKVAKLSNL